jgi:hypothetical protein
MNAVYLRKRNESLQWMWTCLAAAEFLVWAASGSLQADETFLPLLVLVVPLLGISALVHYVFACQRYVSARGHKQASLIAICVLMFSFFSSVCLTVYALIYGAGAAAYFVAPTVFLLSAMPLKLLPDGYSAESP